MPSVRAQPKVKPAPVGFKNGTDGLLDSSINAVKASRQSHYFLGIYENGQSSIIKTKGNRTAT